MPARDCRRWIGQRARNRGDQSVNGENTRHSGGRKITVMGPRSPERVWVAHSMGFRRETAASSPYPRTKGIILVIIWV